MFDYNHLYIVLVVDDDDAVRGALAKLLVARGYDAVETPTAGAVAMARTLGPGLVVLGCELERACSLARELRTHPTLAGAFIVAVARDGVLPSLPADSGIDEYMRAPDLLVHAFAREPS